MDLPRAWKTFGDGHPVYRLLLVSKMIDRETASSLQKEFALSLPEWRILAFVCGLGAASASEIGRSAEIDRAEISRAVAKLEDKQLIRREGDESNRKRLVISPTEAGVELFASVRERRREYSRDVLKGLSEEECETLSRALENIALRIIEKRNWLSG
jgi:DNA-binding MarR family transcriptional regulator